MLRRPTAAPGAISRSSAPAPRTRRPSAIALQPHRLRGGGRIDRRQPLHFTFDGAGYEGYARDTLASALLANGVYLVERSFKYHRLKRGIFGAGAEEPSALVQLGSGTRTEPNVRATQVELYDRLSAAGQNCWPSVRFDLWAPNGVLGPLFPAGFTTNLHVAAELVAERVRTADPRRGLKLRAARARS